ncbi:hypothetical protein ACKVWC_005682 [Pyricularia oryzae]
MKFSKLAFVLGLFAAGANALNSNELAPQDLNDGQLEAIDETTNSEDAANLETRFAKSEETKCEDVDCDFGPASLDESANLEARARRVPA